MRGTNVTTGKALAGLDHLRQSIRDVLTTSIGSRVMLRDYGSRLFELIDAPINKRSLMEIYVAVIEALTKWEPRITISKVTAQSIVAGKVTLALECTYLIDEKPIILDGIVL